MSLITGYWLELRHLKRVKSSLAPMDSRGERCSPTLGPSAKNEAHPFPFTFFILPRSNLRTALGIQLKLGELRLIGVKWLAQAYTTTIHMHVLLSYLWSTCSNKQTIHLPPWFFETGSPTWESGTFSLGHAHHISSLELHISSCKPSEVTFIEQSSQILQIICISSWLGSIMCQIEPVEPE